MRRVIALAFLIAPAAAFALVAAAPAAALAQPGPERIQPPGLTEAVPLPPPDVGRDTHRYTAAAGIGMFANYPMSMEDPGVLLSASKPLWLGNRYRFFQWVAELQGTFGFGGEKKHGYAMAGPYFGWNWYFGSVFGLEFRFGIEAAAQIGQRSVRGITMGGTGAYVFRFWGDDRKRLKLMMHQHAGGYFAEDPGNDLGTNAMAFGIAIAYEQPY